MSVDFGSTDSAGVLPARWIHGQRPGGAPDPLLQVHWYDEHTAIIRQSKSVTFEAPFLYLLFGNERALLLDTGATKDRARFPLRDTVDSLVREWTSRWLAAADRDGYGLVVVHSHAHGDHVAGDGQLSDRPHTVVVGHEVSAVRAFFGLADWPRDRAELDLGGRVLDVLAIPGHHPAHVALLDRWAGLLLTGDSVYPGRLYVRDPRAFAASLDRLAALVEDRAVRHVLGCHIEMTSTPGVDYPVGATYQPDEARLAMTLGQLAEVRAAAHRFVDVPGVHRFAAFHLWIGPCRGAAVRQAGRLLWSRADRLPILRRWR
ncbi:MBL fold metallo-hydrolase [Angustibacter luteus]|uniref:MBL fold metallo-hydrolase n=1 Tax=Angustibacter luteus TaxID=658456 RepID=A0ABW1J9W7_9ACTN